MVEGEKERKLLFRACLSPQKRWSRTDLTDSALEVKI